MKANEEKKRYYKLWRAKNKEKIKAYNDRYWQKRAEKAERELKENEKIIRCLLNGLTEDQKRGNKKCVNVKEKQGIFSMKTV